MSLPVPPLPQLKMNAHNRTLEHVAAGYRRDRYDMDQPYQRGSVWDLQRRQNLVKSLLMGLPIGAITLNDRGVMNSSQYLAVVDGKQRMLAIWSFVDSETPIPAAWVSERIVGETEPIEYEGRTVDGVRMNQLDRTFQRTFENISINTLEAELPDVQAEAELFLLVNFGGVAQTDETRRAAADTAAGA